MQTLAGIFLIVGSCRRWATATSGPRRTGWRPSGFSKTRVMRAHDERKRAAGKSKMNALAHCMRKALRLVWGVWRNGLDFDPRWGAEP
jgi:hypothetical protein